MNQENAVLITGAAKRVGRAIALHLAHGGYDIAIHYHTSAEQAHSLQTEIEALGRKTTLIQADLASPDCEAIIAQAKAALPHLNALIHNASVFKETNFHQTTEVEYNRDMDLHVKTPYFLSQAYAKQIGQGNIICMLDTNIRKESKIYFPYMLAKKSLAALMRQLAKELAPHIRVNAIAPGITPFSDELPDEYVTHKLQTLPLRRVADPQDIARAAEYLLTADYLVGHTLYIDGGEQLL